MTIADFVRWIRRVLGLRHPQPRPTPEPTPAPPLPPAPVLVPVPAVRLPRLRVRGQCFELDTGEYWTAIEATDFRLFRRFLDGESIAPILKQRREVGFNLLRVLGMCEQMFRLHPQEIVNYYEQLTAFARQVAEAGLRVEFVAFADATRVMPLFGNQHNHLATSASSLAGGVHLLELVNENDQSINRVNTDMFTQPTGLLSSHGSHGSEARPVEPFWDYATFHTNDAPEWWRKVGHNAMELWTGPTLANENTRAPDRFSSLTQAYDAAAGAALLCAGSCFHSVSGKSSSLWEGLELELAKAWAAGARSVPLWAQDGVYRHPIEEEGPDDLRVYQRVLPDRRYTVHIRK